MCYSKKNIPVFHLSYQRTDLAVRVTVNNTNGDDAYEARLLATFPKMLSYSGVRSHAATVRETSATSCGHMYALHLIGRNMTVCFMSFICCALDL